MINDWMVKLFGASWKPTISGIIGGLAFAVTQMPNEFPHWVVVMATVITVAGLVATGVTAKGAHVTGGNTPNTTNNPLIVAQTSTGPVTKDQINEAVESVEHKP